MATHKNNQKSRLPGVMIYVCVADLFCGLRAAALNASGLGLAEKNIALDRRSIGSQAR